MNVERTDIFMASLGFEVFRVGGSVRDELLGRAPKDADYMIRGATLREIADALHARGKQHPRIERFAVKPLTLRDGRQAGWRVSGKGLGSIEIVLPRTEISTGPGHRDFEIVVDPTLPLAADAERRDFTFNAIYDRIQLAWEVAIVHSLEDPTGRGLYDLQHKLIHTTHPDSFRDDPLRILRALRFVSTLGYDLSTNTRAEMAAHAAAVTGLSLTGHASGTVLEELSKLLMGQNPVTALRLARDTGVLATLLPELAPMIGFEQGSRYHNLTADEHTFSALETAAHVDAPLRVRMALLFHDSGKPECAWVGKDGRMHYYAMPESEQFYRRGRLITTRPASLEDHEDVGERIWNAAAKRLNAPRPLQRDVATLIREHMVPVKKVNPVKVRRSRVRLGDDILRDLYLMRMCDLSAKGKADLEAIAKVGEMECVRSTAEALGVPASVKDLKINGMDVQPLVGEPRQIGEVLRAVLDEVVCDPEGPKLTREWQLSQAGALAR